MKVKRDLMSVYLFSIVYALNVILGNNAIAFFSFIGISVILLLLCKSTSNVFYFYIFVAINTQLTNVSYSGIYITHIIAVVNLIYIGTIFLLKKEDFKQIKKDWLLFLAIWSMYCILQTYFIYSERLVNSVVSMFYNVSICLVSLYMKNRDINKLIKIISFSVCFMVVLGYVELLLGKTFFYSTWTQEERYRFGILRVGSTMGDANFLCSILVPMYFAFNLKTFIKINGKKFTRCLTWMMILLIISTFSRAGIISLILGFVIVYLCNSLKKTILHVPLFLGTSVFAARLINNFLNYQIESRTARHTVTLTAIQQWLNSPIYGNGWDWFSKNSLTFMGIQWDTMNTYVYLLVNLGLIGLIFLIIYYVKLSKRTFSIWAKFNHRIKSNESLLIACLASWMVMSFTLDEFNLAFMWILPTIFCLGTEENIKKI